MVPPDTTSQEIDNGAPNRHESLPAEDESSFTAKDSSIPEDLMELEYEPSEEEATDRTNMSGPRPGDVEASVVRVRPYGRVLLVFLLAVGILVWFIGYLQRNNLIQLLSQTVRSASPSIELIESCDDVVLMLERSGKHSRIIVEKAGRAAWVLVSKDDTTVTNPALSPDGKFVAYVSERDGGQIVIISLTADKQYTVTLKQVRSAGQKEDLDGMKICPWTPISWDAESRQIAFFGCIDGGSLSRSVVLICKIAEPTLTLGVVVPSLLDSSITRQVKWLGFSQLIVSTATNNSELGATVTRFDVP